MGFTLANDGLFIDEGHKQRVTNVTQFGFHAHVGRRRVAQFRRVTIVVVIRHLSISDDSDNGEGFTIIDLHCPIRFNCRFVLMRPQTRCLRHYSVRVNHRVTHLFCFCSFFHEFVVALYSCNASGERQTFLAYEQCTRPVR